MPYTAVSILAGAALAACLFCQSGCEPASGLQGLTVTPAYVELPVGSNSVQFTVGGGPSNSLQLPIEWTVSNPELGYIVSASGLTALYHRHGLNGENVITARDQYDNEGYATIVQVQGVDSLTLSAVRADTNTWTVSIQNPTHGPYEWWVHDPSLGTITSVGNGESAVYDVKDWTRSNDVYVRDPESRMGAVRIP